MHFADVCCLQETKLEKFTSTTWREVGGSRLDQFIFVPANRSAGGIAVGWNSVLLSERLTQAREFSIIVEFFCKKNNLRWLYTIVYGPNERAHKQVFWEELRNCKGATPIPWVICGDFIAIFAMKDKPSSNLNLSDIR